MIVGDCACYLEGLFEELVCSQRIASFL